MPAINIKVGLYKRAIKLDLDLVEIANRKVEEVIIETERERDVQ